MDWLDFFAGAGIVGWAWGLWQVGKRIVLKVRKARARRLHPSRSSWTAGDVR